MNIIPTLTILFIAVTVDSVASTTVITGTDPTNHLSGIPKYLITTKIHKDSPKQTGSLSGYFKVKVNTKTSGLITYVYTNELFMTEDKKDYQLNPDTEFRYTKPWTVKAEDIESMEFLWSKKDAKPGDELIIEYVKVWNSVNTKTWTFKYDKPIKPNTLVLFKKFQWTINYRTKITE